jgi:hypothetical protein
VRNGKRLTGLQIATWAALGVAGGLVAGFALGEWVGDLNRPRLRRIARRMQERDTAPVLGPAAAARAALAALRADRTLEDLDLTATAVASGVVELRGWVPSRSLRTRAARVAVAVPGINSVINRILVHGEDDRTLPADLKATDQSA